MIIFSPGPANISERVRKALTLPDICHRDEEASQLLVDVRASLAQAFDIEDGSHEVVVFSGSGTLAIESLVACLTNWEQTLLIVSNGIYGERVADIARVLGVRYEVLELDWGRLPDLAQVEELVARPHIGGVYLVHHETTTGLLNPLREVSRVARSHGKLVVSDTISSIIGEYLNLDWGVDAILGTANKCFRGVPGVAFAVVSNAFLAVARRREKRTYYSDLLTHLDREAAGETPFTPPLQSLFAFREAIRETLEEGLDNRIAHYADISGQLRAGLRELGLRLYLPEERYSNTMTSVYLPPRFTFQQLHDPLKEKGFVIYNSQGRLRGTVFMLGVVGLIAESDIKQFLTALGETLKAAA